MTADPETDDLGERVRRLLDEAEERVAALDDEGATEELEDVAGRANELLSETDPTELLDAVAPEDRSEGEDPETIAEAIAASDRETVVTLRKLLALSKMDDGDDDALAEHVEEFRELSDVAGGDDEAPSEDRESDEPVDGSTEASDSGDGSDYADQLREALQGGIDEFREGIERTRAELADETEAETSDEADTTDRAGGAEGTMFSTIPSRDRADMRGTTRLSTVRKRRRDDD